MNSKYFITCKIRGLNLFVNAFVDGRDMADIVQHYSDYSFMDLVGVEANYQGRRLDPRPNDRLLKGDFDRFAQAMARSFSADKKIEAIVEAVNLSLAAMGHGDVLLPPEPMPGVIAIVDEGNVMHLSVVGQQVQVVEVDYANMKGEAEDSPGGLLSKQAVLAAHAPTIMGGTLADWEDRLYDLIKGAVHAYTGETMDDRLENMLQAPTSKPVDLGVAP